jgi:hypothetical protein
MKVDKIKRKAKIVMSNSKKLNSNFFLSQELAIISIFYANLFVFTKTKVT